VLVAVQERGQLTAMGVVPEVHGPLLVDVRVGGEDCLESLLWALGLVADLEQ
jgi:hypothetical protein